MKAFQNRRQIKVKALKGLGSKLRSSQPLVIGSRETQEVTFYVHYVYILNQEILRVSYERMP